MAFDDAFGSGQDQLRQSLLDQYQPDDGQPFSVEPKVLTDRLARKLAMRPTKDADVDFNVAPEAPKQPDLAKFGTPVKDEAIEPSTDDLSKFGTPVTPEGPPVPPLTISRQAAALAKGIPHGAIEGAGGVMKGLGTAYELSKRVPAGEFSDPLSGSVSPEDAAKQREFDAARLRDTSTAVASNPLVKAGKATQEFAQTAAPMTDQEKQSIGGRIGTGAGAIAPYALTTLVAGPLAGIGAAATGMATDTYGSVYEAAKAAGKTDDEAAATAGKSALVAGVLGGLPFGASHLGKAPIIGATLKPYLDTLIGKIAASSATFATLGEAQEAILQQIAKDYDPKAGYTFDQKRLIAELILGAGMGGLHHAFRDRGQQQPQPAPGTPPPGAAPGVNPGLPPGAGPQPGAQARGGNQSGPQPGPQPGAGPQGGSQPGAGPQGGPGATGNASSNATGNAGAKPGGPPPGTGTGKAGEAGYTMDPATRAKMERVYAHFEQGKDPSGMSDGELYDAVNEHLRDTSSTGHTAKPETPEEAAAREQAATDREQRDVLKKAGWTEAHINAMTPEQREQYVARAQGKAAPEEPQSASASKGASNPDEKINTGAEPVKGGVNPPDNGPVNPTPGTRAAPIKAATAADILNAEPVEPKSSAQAQAENYKHAHVEIEHLGLTGRNSISIETGVGQERKGISSDGKEWSVTMPVAYGRIKGTKGGDGQPLDIFVGPQPTSPHVFVIDQHHGNGGGFDEHKIMAGFPGPDAALRAYSDSYNDKGGDRIGHVTAMTPDEFQTWLKSDTSVALKKDLRRAEIGGRVGHPTEENAAGSKIHHSPEPALTNPGSHHASGPASEENTQTKSNGGTPQPAGYSLGLTKPVDSAAVKRGTTGTDGGDGRSSATKGPPKRAVEPQNLLQFIASRGGLKPHPELTVMDAHKHLVTMSGFPPRRKLVKDDGMDLDRAREAAEEAGYFRGSHEGTSTVAEFLDAIDDGIRGQHRYPEGEEGHRTKRELTAEEEHSAYVETRAKEMVDELEGAGHGQLGPEIKDRVLHIMAIEGADPDAAVHIALAQLDAEEHLATANEFDDMLGNGAYDEIHAEVPYDDGRESQREGQDGRGGQEAAPAEPRARAPDRGENVGPEDEGHDAGRAESANGEPDTGGATGDQAARRGAENPADADRSLDTLDGKTAEIQAGDSDETVTVTLSRKGPWDFNDTWPAPDPKAIDALARRGHPVFEIENGEHFDVEQVVGVLDEGMNSIVIALGQVRTIDAMIADIRAGKVKLKKKQKPEDAIQALQTERKAYGREAVDTAASYEEVFGNEAARAMMIEARRRLRGEDRQRDKGVDRNVPEPQSIDDFIAGIEREIAAGRTDADISPTRSLADFQKAAEARGWTYAAYGKGKALWSPDRSHVIFASVSVEGNHVTAQWSKPSEGIAPPTGTKPEKPKEPTAAERKAERDAPTWAEILHELPMSKDGRTRQHEIAFDAITAMTGKKKPKYDDLTPAQKHELLARVKAEKPAITETGADNKPQMVLPGAGKASDGTMAKRAAAAPLKPKVAQKAADDGLFGDGHKQTDLLDMAAAPPKQPKPAEPPKDAFDDIFDQAIDAEFAPKMSLNIDDVAKGLGKLFGKGLSEPEAPFDDTKYQAAVPFFKAGVEHFGAGGADLATMVRSLVRHLSVAGMDADAIRAMKPYIRRFTDDVTAGRETINAPSRSDVLESDRGKPEAGNGVGKADVPAAAGPAGQGAGQRGSAADAGDERPAGSGSVSQDHAPAVGAHGNLELPAREPVDEGSDAGDREHQRSGADSQGGFSFDDGTTDEAVRNAQKDSDLNARRQRQQQADRQRIPFKWGRIDNIAESLPMLFPEQHYDVQSAELRFNKTEGHGMLFTNGTGTGKTYSGLGIIKRFVQQGKTNTLVIAPSQGILMDWVKSAKDLGLDMTVLDSTMDKGKGLVATTYANLGANRVLADREWDLVVADEAHKLSSDKDGTSTAALGTFRALTLHPDGLTERARMVLRADWDRIDHLPKDSQPAAYAAFQKKADPLIAKWKDQQRPKALMLSATPFAYHFSLDYAEGYLFDFDRDDQGSRYNSGGGREKFYMQHLGYRMRTNKLTKPDADVKSEVMERQLHEYLKKQGSLSGRALTVDKDYDRKFVLAHDAVGQQIDQALNFLQEAEDGRYRPLHEIIGKQFDYLTRMRLLEAIKARAAVSFIKESLALGRKIVVFHDYNEGGGINPFDLSIGPEAKTTTYQNGKHVEVSLKDMYDDFRAHNPYIKDLKFASYLPPIAELTKSFPDAMVYNGTVSNKIRNEAKRLFNDDDSKRDIIIVQSAAGEAGISLHDTTGKRQRVLLNLGMPIRPTASIQQEGRIYRVGQSSDAIFRYMNTGTDWERWTFAGKIADRAGTAENLAMGDLARTIRQSFIDAFSNAGDYAPEHGEGKGGKEADRAISHSVSEFDKAKTHYFANGKTTGRRDQREGVDYYATPEPVGLKMVEFAGVKSGEKILEPSAGHGAIARYFPEDTARTLVEPSSSLASRAALTSPGARVVVDRFENLDKGANKFDAIVMNPPFGTGGATAIEHLRKAMGHLKNGGRIVALIPRGSTDEKFNKLMDSTASKDVYLVGDINLPPVTFERAGTSISSRIVVLEKQTDQEVRAKLQSKSRDYSDVTKIGELFDRIEHAVLPDRLEPVTKDVDATAGRVTINGVDFDLWNERDGTTHYADLKSFLGASRFRDVVNASERAGGIYMKTVKGFKFPTAEARQNFLTAVANPAPESAPKAPSGVTFKTGETIHAKTGGKLFVATANERVAPDVYSQMNAAAKASGGYYSSFKGRGAIPGFQFKSDEDRAKFLSQMGGALGESEPPLAATGSVPVKPLGETAQQHVLARGRETGVEHLVAYDAKGNIVDNGDHKGTHNRITISPEFFAHLLDPNEDIVIHHNHPKGSSFSHDDIAFASLPGARAVWAHGHDGNIYRVEVTPTGKAMLPAQWEPRSKQIERLVNAIEFSILIPIKKAFKDGKVDAHEANIAVPHLVNVVLRDAGFIDYLTNVDDADFRARVSGLDDNIAKAVDLIRKQVTDAGVHDRPARAVRHLGDVGAVFDRGAVARPVTESRRSNPQSGADDQRDEKGPGLAQPSNAFKKPGSHDVAIADILRTRLLGRLGDLNATEARTQLQDKFARVKNAEESVGAPTSQSAYQAESLYYGRTGQRLEALTEHHIDPLIREMKARDIDLDKLDEFLYARHAPERNQKIGRMYAHQPGHDFYRAVHDPDVVGASGMSTNDALGVIRALRAAGKLQDYLAVARMVDALNARTRRVLFDAGLIDRDTFDAWNSGYKYYVPLRGHAEGAEFMAAGSGMNVRGKEAKTAFGRRSKADSPLAYTIMQAEMAIVRAEKNTVGGTFLQFVRANPDPARWTIDRPPLVKRIDPTTGLVTAVPDNLYANRDNVFTTKVNGRDVHITLHGPDGLNMARALKSMGTANVHRLIRAYSALTHTMAKLATSFNPEFMIPNFARDMGEAFINLQAQDQRGFVKNFVRHIPGAMRGSMAAIAGRTPAIGTSAARYVDAFHRFDKAGGRVRFFGIDDPDAIETNVSRRLKRLEGGPLNTLKDIADKAGKALEIAGGGIENATRLAAFMAAEDAGISTADAAMLARNLTVDFNKKGELGSAVAALYMFANAGIQGQARMTRALGHRRVWQAVGGLAAAAALSTLYSILASDVDETGIPDYMKIPAWERDKNLIFTLGGHYHLKVPLPYGFAPFAVIGSHAVSVAMGHEKPGKAASAVMDSVLNAFNPLGEESTAWMDIVPSAIRPAFHIEFNKNWTGKPLYPDQDKNRGNRPESTQAFKSNSAFSKEAAKQLNAWSGGSPYQPGAIDVHPASIDHTLQAITGGVGHFVKGIVDSLYNNLSGGEWQPEKAPILRRFIGKVGPEADTALYYEKRQESLDEKAGVNAARKDLKGGVNTEEAHQFLDETPSSKASIFKSADDRIKALRAQKNLTETELRDRIRQVQNQARAQVQRLQPSQ